MILILSPTNKIHLRVTINTDLSPKNKDTLNQILALFFHKDSYFNTIVLYYQMAVRLTRPDRRQDRLDDNRRS